MNTNGIAFTLGPLTVKWYGILIASAMAIGLFLAAREGKKKGIVSDDILDVGLWVLPAAVIGARIYYVLFSWDYYSAHPGEIIKIWHGGMAIHGGLIGAILAGILYGKLKKKPFWLFADVAMPSVALGQAIGRWGNFFNQEAYGYETDLPWAMYIDGAYRHPTFLYESIWDLGLCLLLLWYLNRPPQRQGYVLALYAFGYSLGRFFIEQLRTDSLMFGPFRMAMVISVAGMAVGVAIFLWQRNHGKDYAYLLKEKVK